MLTNLKNCFHNSGSQIFYAIFAALNKIYGYMKYKNNPFNIRYSSRNNWLGQEKPVNGFCTFDTLQHGLRAMCKLLQTYHRSGCNTVSSIISRFAPASENDTDAYKQFVLFGAMRSSALKKFDRQSTWIILRPDVKLVYYSVDTAVLVQRMAFIETNTLFKSSDILLMLYKLSNKQDYVEKKLI